jgi:hypothetical protein
MLDFEVGAGAKRQRRLVIYYVHIQWIMVVLHHNSGAKQRSVLSKTNISYFLPGQTCNNSPTHQTQYALPAIVSLPCPYDAICTNDPHLLSTSCYFQFRLTWPITSIGTYPLPPQQHACLPTCYLCALFPNYLRYIDPNPRLADLVLRCQPYIT